MLEFCGKRKKLGSVVLESSYKSWSCCIYIRGLLDKEGIGASKCTGIGALLEPVK